MNRTSLKVLAAIVGFSFAIAPHVAADEELASAGEVVGLKIRKGKVIVRSVSKRARSIDIPPRAGEEEVEADNAKVAAFQGFDEKGTCRLRLVEPKTKAEVFIRCPSTWILVPKTRDVVWIIGKSANEGIVEHGRQSPYAGAHLYDFSGRLLRSFPKEEIGFVEHAHELASGELLLLVHKDKEFRLTRLGADGQVQSSIPIPAAKYEGFAVMRGGKSIALNSFEWKDRTRRAALLDESGREVFAYAGSTDEYPAIAGVQADGLHVALGRDSPGGHLVEVFDVTRKGKPVKTFRVPFHPKGVELSNDLDRLVARSAPRPEDGAHKYSYALIGGKGELLATAECKHMGWRHDSRTGVEDSVFRWLCGDQWVTLEVRSAK